MHNALTATYNIHTKRIVRGIHIPSFQHNNYLSFRRIASMIEKIGEPAMLEQLAEESVELAKACLKLARKLRGENPTPKSKAECQRELLEEFTDVIQCSRELKLQPDEEQIEEKHLRFLTRWTAATQSKIDSKKRHTQ
jgi:NTP pyrophosphatase (non-canonical NTP hydrolase)